MGIRSQMQMAYGIEVVRISYTVRRIDGDDRPAANDRNRSDHAKLTPVELALRVV
jgi:hypothetical protein